MKIELKLLKAKKETSEGFPLVFEISHQGKRKQKNISYCKVNHFSETDKMVTIKHPDFDILQPLILDYKIKARKIILSGVNDVDQAYKLLFEFHHKEKTFIEFANDLINEMKETQRFFEKKNDINSRNKIAGNISVYENVINQFLPFGQKKSFDEITYEVLHDFKIDKTRSGNKKNTIHLYLRTLRAIYNKGVKKYQLPNKMPFNGVFDGLKVKSYASKKKYIDKAAIEKLENYKGTKMKREMVDLFLLQFYFGGADLIDVYFLEKKQLKKNKVFFERGKTNTGLLIELKIVEKAAAILKKYDNTSNYVFPFRKDIEGYKTFRTRYAKLLKKVQEELSIEVYPVGGNLSVKVARHTFANIAKNLFLEPDLIRELMGHERDDVDNYYKDKYPEKVRDEALIKIVG